MSDYQRSAAETERLSRAYGKEPPRGKHEGDVYKVSGEVNGRRVFVKVTGEREAQAQADRWRAQGVRRVKVGRMLG